MNLLTNRRLAEDHEALGKILEQLKSSLTNGDVQNSHATLDLFWARLAVHIRAEHLHLFPAVTNRMSEAHTVVEDLLEDHDFFMRELARAITILRDLTSATDPKAIDEGLATVRGIVAEVEKRLILHNEAEETRVYRWATTVLNEQEQLELAARVNAELKNHPPRFSNETWSTAGRAID